MFGGEEEYQASGIQRKIGAMSLEKYLQKLPLAATAEKRRQFVQGF